MSKTYVMVAEKREVIGKQVKRLRREGIVPANIFSKAKDSMAVQVPYLLMVKTYEQAGRTHPISLQIGEAEHLVLISEVDVDPVKGTIRHISFHEVKRGEKVTAEVPVHLTGDCPAEMKSLMIVQMNDSVEVEAEATNIPDHLDADRSKLSEPDDVILVGDLPVPDGVTIMTEPDTPIAKVETPRDIEAEEAAAAAEAAEAETPEAESAETPKDGESTPAAE